MPTPDMLHAFVLAAELGSFSAAARRMNKAQSAVSTAIANLEIDTGLTLFDRSTRSPTLTRDGQALLPHARGILLGHAELMAKATSLAGEIEDSLCLAIEKGIDTAPVFEILVDFQAEFPHVSLDLLTPGPNDTAGLLKEGRADLGLMTEQESYPIGFQFRGVGHSQLVPVCAPSHPLAGADTVTYGDLRAHRQLVLRSRSLEAPAQIGSDKSPRLWHAESPAILTDLLIRGLGWAELPLPVLRPALEAGDLVRLRYDFQQSDDLLGIDVVWTEQRSLGMAGQWLRRALLDLPQERWREG